MENAGGPQLRLVGTQCLNYAVLVHDLIAVSYTHLDVYKRQLLRREQGYTAASMVEESRMLQVSIFQTLQNNLFRVDFSLLLVGVMAIADEVDSQLAQAMASYISESKADLLPA